MERDERVRLMDIAARKLGPMIDSALPKSTAWVLTCVQFQTAEGDLEAITSTLSNMQDNDLIKKMLEEGAAAIEHHKTVVTNVTALRLVPTDDDDVPQAS